MYCWLQCERFLWKGRMNKHCLSHVIKHHSLWLALERLLTCILEVLIARLEGLLVSDRKRHLIKKKHFWMSVLHHLVHSWWLLGITFHVCLCKKINGGGVILPFFIYFVKGSMGQNKWINIYFVFFVLAWWRENH